MAITLFNAFLGRMPECYFNGATPPAINSFYLILTNGGSIDTTSNLATVLAQECSGYGYARTNYDPGTGGYDSTQARYEMPPVLVSVSATGGAIVFDKAVLIGGAGATGSTGELICFQAQPSATTVPDGTTYSFKIEFNAGGNAADVNAA